GLISLAARWQGIPAQALSASDPLGQLPLARHHRSERTRRLRASPRHAWRRHFDFAERRRQQILAADLTRARAGSFFDCYGLASAAQKAAAGIVTRLS